MGENFQMERNYVMVKKKRIQRQFHLTLINALGDIKCKQERYAMVLIHVSFQFLMI